MAQKRPPPVPPRWQRGDVTPLVDRAAEMALVEHALERLAARHGQVLTITGDLGIGKTRVSEELGLGARHRGHVVLWGRASGADATPKLGPIREAFGTAPIAPSTDLESGVGVRQALELQADGVPPVLVLEDLQWADDATIELLTGLLGDVASIGVLLALTCRTGQWPPALERPLGQAEAAGTLTSVELAPLDAAATELLLDRGLAPGVREEIVRESAGNPLFALALSRATKRGDEPAAALPSDLVAAIVEDVSSLSRRARDLLEAAAVVGEPLQPELSRAMAKLDPPEAALAIRELVERGLLRTPGRWERFLVFRAPLLRRAIYNTTGLAARLEKHRRMAQLLEQRAGALSTRAHHAARGGGGDPGEVDVLLQAAESASADAPHLAARWRAAALQSMPHHDERKPSTLVGTAASLVAAGRIAEASQVFDNAIDIIASQRIDDPATLASLARVEHLLGAAGPSRTLLRRALERRSDDRSTAVLRTVLTIAHWRMGETAEMTRAAHDAMTAARACGDAGVRMHAAIVFGLTEQMEGRTTAARKALDEAERVMQVLPDVALSNQLEFLLFLAHLNHALERYESAARHIERGLRLSARTHAYLHALFGVARGSVEHTTGRLREATRTGDELLAVASRLGSEQLIMRVHTLRAMAAVGVGRLEVAVQAAEDAARAADAVPTGFTTVGTRCLLGLVRVRAGDHHQGQQLILSHGGGPELTRLEAGLRPDCYAMLAWAARLARDGVLAESWTERAEASADELRLIGRVAAARTARAGLLLETDPRRAGEIAAQAAWEHQSAGRIADHGRALALAGQAHARAGDRGRAIATLESAHAVLVDCGAERQRDLVARWLRECGRPTPRPAGRAAAAATGVDGLSQRERQVAELVAQGLTNNGIAEEMFVTAKTVEDHLTRAFAKVGVSSRAGLAAAIAGAATTDGSGQA